MASQVQVNVAQAEKSIKDLMNAFIALSKEIAKQGEVGKISMGQVSKELKQVETIAKTVDVTIANLTKAYKNLAKSQKNAFTQLRNTKAELKKSKATIDSVTKALREKTKELKKANAQYAAMRKQQASGMFKKMKAGVMSLVGAFGVLLGVQALAKLATDSFRLARTFDSLGFAMRAVITDSKEYAQTVQWISRITKDFGADIVTVTERYTKFRAAAKQANLSAEETQKIFGTMTKAAGVLGLRTDELKGVFLALEQMISKGKITTEELRRQLGERLPGAMDIMANAVGVTTAELDEMLKKGEVITKDVLPAFAEEVEKAFGLETIVRVETLQAATVRLSNSWKELVVNASNTSGATNTLMVVFDHLAKNLKLVLNVVGGLIAVWGTYKAVQTAAILQTAIMNKIIKIQAANLAMATQARLLNNTAILQGTKAVSLMSLRMAALNKVMKANALFLAIVVIAGLVTAFNALTKGVLETSSALNELNKESLDGLENTAKQIKEVEALAEAYERLRKITNPTLAEQKELIDVATKIGKIYPTVKGEVDRYGNAQTILTEALAKRIKLEKEIIELESAKIITDQFGSLEELNKQYDDFNNNQSVNTKGIREFRVAMDGSLEVVKSTDKGMKIWTKSTDSQTIAIKKWQVGMIDAMATSGELEKRAVAVSDSLKQSSKDLRGELELLGKAQLDTIAAAKALANENQTITGIDKQIKDLQDAQKTLVTTDLYGDQTADTENAKKYAKIQKEIDDLQARKNVIMGVTLDLGSKRIKQLRIIRDLTLEINNLELEKKVIELEVIGGNDTLNFSTRDKAFEDAQKLKTQIAEQEANYQIAVNKAKFEKEKAIWDLELKNDKLSLERRTEISNFITALEKENGDKELIEKSKLAIRKFEIERELFDQLANLRGEEDSAELDTVRAPFIERANAARELFNIQISGEEDNIKKANEVYENSNKNLKDRIIRDKAVFKAKKIQADAEEKFTKELESVKVKGEQAVLAVEIQRLEVLLAIKKIQDQGLGVYGDEIKQLEEQIEQLKTGLKLEVVGKDPSSLVGEWQETFAEILDLASQFNDAIADLGNAIFDAKIENINAEIAKTEEKYDKQLELAEGDELQRKTLEQNKAAALAKLEKKRLKEEQKKARFNKATAITDILINTAVAISAQLANPLFAGVIPIIAAIGAAQVAAVLSSPVPKYAEGLDRADSDHVAMINDGGQQEYIGRGSSILTTNKKDALVSLKTGDTVFKDYDDLSKKSMLMQGLYGGVQVEEKDFNLLFDGMTGAIQKGFSKAKVNNNITLKGIDPEYIAYKNEQLNWTD